MIAKVLEGGGQIGEKKGMMVLSRDDTDGTDDGATRNRGGAVEFVV